jgi:hypothetical protein
MGLKLCLELCGSALNFVGGGVLTLDAFTGRKRALTESGLQVFQAYAQGTPVEAVLKYKGRPIKDIDQGELDLIAAGKTLRRGQVGMCLLTIGFLIDLVAKLWFG